MLTKTSAVSSMLELSIVQTLSTTTCIPRSAQTTRDGPGSTFRAVVDLARALFWFDNKLDPPR